MNTTRIAVIAWTCSALAWAAVLLYAIGSGDWIQASLAAVAMTGGAFAVTAHRRKQHENRSP